MPPIERRCGADGIAGIIPLVRKLTLAEPNTEMRGKSKAALEAHRVASVSLVLMSYVSACGKGIIMSEPGR